MKAHEIFPSANIFLQLIHFYKKNFVFKFINEPPPKSQNRNEHRALLHQQFGSKN
jgi:hypothetical protein